MADLPQRGGAGSTPPARTPSRDVPSRAVAPDHQLPAGGTKLERIAQHSKGLVDDITSWIDLRIKLAKLEIQEEIQQQKNQVVVLVIVAVFGALGGLFGLLAAALGVAALFAIFLSWPLSLFLGFLVVAVLLLLVAFAVNKAQPSFFEGQPHVAVDDDDLRSASRTPAGDSAG